MTTTRAKKHLVRQAKLAQLEKVLGTDINEHVDDAISLGLRDLWTARPWGTRTKTQAVTIVNGVGTCPVDFGGLYRSLKEPTAARGQQLHFMRKEDFDSQYPVPSEYSGMTPAFFTLYEDNGVWRLVVVPNWSGTLSFDYFRKAPNTAEGLPEHLWPAFMAAAGMYLFPVGTKEFWSAENNYQKRLNAAKIQDGPTGTMGGHFRDDTEEPAMVRYPWMP